MYIRTFQNLLHCGELTQSCPGHVVIFPARQTTLGFKYTNLVRLKPKAKFQIMSLGSGFDSKSGF